MSLAMSSTALTLTKRANGIAAVAFPTMAEDVQSLAGRRRTRLCTVRPAFPPASVAGPAPY